MEQTPVERPAWSADVLASAGRVGHHQVVVVVTRPKLYPIEHHSHPPHPNSMLRVGVVVKVGKPNISVGSLVV